MIWADMKKYIAEKMCENLRDLKIAISEYVAQCTPEKCQNFIEHLHEVIEEKKFN
jgi:hypothetical protein